MIARLAFQGPSFLALNDVRVKMRATIGVAIKSVGQSPAAFLEPVGVTDGFNRTRHKASGKVANLFSPAKYASIEMPNRCVSTFEDTDPSLARRAGSL